MFFFSLLNSHVLYVCRFSIWPPSPVLKELPQAVDMVFLMRLYFASFISHCLTPAAIITNCADTEDEMLAAGRVSGDLTHPLLFCPEFLQEEFKSEGLFLGP